MKKLRTVIQYECSTSFKYIWLFYSIVFAVVLITAVITCIGTGSTDKSGINGLEFNSVIYVGILGVMGFKEDFKMLIQNGFTRKYIFLSTFSLFVFVSGIMALVDTVVGKVLHLIYDSYDSIFGGLYGYGHSVFLNWFWLFLVYMLVCCSLYLAILVINRMAKTTMIYTGVILGLTIILVIPALVRFVLPKEFTDKVIEVLMKSMGFMTDGTINFIYPILLLVVIAGIMSICSYYVIRRTELKV
ncbi:MAG: hypothetical protein Q4D16_25310 [Eubacteriales bacterium]|nr:hypothetical protein [Eubacteriales bacterium]